LTQIIEPFALSCVDLVVTTTQTRFHAPYHRISEGYRESGLSGYGYDQLGFRPCETVRHLGLLYCHLVTWLWHS